jgi:hypothetical protein
LAGGFAVFAGPRLATRLAFVGAASGVTTLAGYLLASRTRDSGFEGWLRGFMIGVNAGLNAAVLSVGGLALEGSKVSEASSIPLLPLGPHESTIASFLPGSPVLLLAMGALGLLNLGAALGRAAEGRLYQTLLGYGNWLLPMSWAVMASGALFFIFDILVALLTLNRWGRTRIRGMAFDFRAGGVCLVGGLIGPLCGSPAFNMGSFSFFVNKSALEHLPHERGHAVNLAAFGSVFHFAGAIEQNVLGAGPDAYSERLADGYLRSPGPDPLPEP